MVVIFRLTRHKSIASSCHIFYTSNSEKTKNERALQFYFWYRKRGNLRLCNHHDRSKSRVQCSMIEKAAMASRNTITNCVPSVVSSRHVYFKQNAMKNMPTNRLQTKSYWKKQRFFDESSFLRRSRLSIITRRKRLLSRVPNSKTVLKSTSYHS